MCIFFLVIITQESTFLCVAKQKFVLYFFNEYRVNLVLIGFMEVKNNIFKLKTKIRLYYTSFE